MDIMPEKRCAKCHQRLPHTTFAVVPRLSDCPTCPRDMLCQPCRTLHTTELSQKEERRQQKALKRKEKAIEKVCRRYALAYTDFEKLLEIQQNRCAICHKLMENLYSEKRRLLYIDHDHITGQIRGLLCNSCNQGLGFFRDNITFLQRAALYLQEAALYHPQVPINMPSPSDPEAQYLLFGQTHMPKSRKKKWSVNHARIATVVAEATTRLAEERALSGQNHGNTKFRKGNAFGKKKKDTYNTLDESLGIERSFRPIK